VLGTACFDTRAGKVLIRQQRFSNSAAGYHFADDPKNTFATIGDVVQHAASFKGLHLPHDLLAASGLGDDNDSHLYDIKAALKHAVTTCTKLTTSPKYGKTNTADADEVPDVLHRVWTQITRESPEAMILS